MTTFAVIAAALALMAPLFVAVPLLRRPSRPGLGEVGAEPKLSVYRDQLAELDEEQRAGRLSDDQLAQARGEIESRLIDELPDPGVPVLAPTPRYPRVVAVAASLAVPLLAFLLYIALGNPVALRPQQADDSHGAEAQQMNAMIVRLAARLEKSPQDANGWAMLARAQTVLGRLDEASVTYAKAVALFPDDPQLLVDYADVMAMANGGRLLGEPEQLVAHALRADPNNAKALALAGTIAFDKQDFALAIKHWEHLRNSMPTDSEFVKSVEVSITEARRLLLATADPRSDKTRTSTNQ
ncbi:MAG: c-type cytochrome biogenesis protein CcmI [Polaromonas sp.]|nr:c-type cytochrome biogenesis protein CcmI [Polaromonas sp.]